MISLCSLPDSVTESSIRLRIDGVERLKPKIKKGLVGISVYHHQSLTSKKYRYRTVPNLMSILAYISGRTVTL